MDKHWFVFYTKSRHEKKVRDVLLKRGYEVFLPLQKTMRQWSDRKKKVEVPLFNSYIFVQETADKIPEILQVPGISWNIRYNDKPAILWKEEKDVIQRFIATGLAIETATAQEFKKGDEVEVQDGPLKNMRGTIVRTTEGERFSILLESIHQNIIINLDPGVLRPLN